MTVWGYVDDCIIRSCGNVNVSAPAVNVSTNSTSDTHVRLSGNLIYDCPAAAISIYGNNANLWIEVDSCTIANNAAGIVKGSPTSSLAIAHSILWDNGDDLNGVSSGEVSCSDISDGDFNGVNGNFSTDPMFCDPADGVYSLNAQSPCLTGFGCGRIGAFGSCSNIITAISDIGNDQGRAVRLTFTPNVLDTVGSPTPITRYDVFRRIDQLPMAMMPMSAGRLASPDGVMIVGWDYVLSVPAYCEDEYNVVVPTLADSNSAGMFMTAFFVRAATASPGVFFDTAPDSGYSVDNLAPFAPTGFMASYVAGNNELTWEESEAADFQYFKVYRSTDPGFVPGPENLVHTTTTTAWTDAGGLAYYKLSAVDFNGNEGAFASTAITVGVDDQPNLVFSLEPVKPNPAAGRTFNVTFSLPTAAPAQLALVDVAGRKIATHEFMTAGRQTVNLAAGQRLAAGVYFIKLTQGSNARSTRVVVVQ